MVDAVVVGAGPNGLAAAVAIAREGHEVTVLEAAETIGGGTRTEELTVPGVLHDVCSAVHPFGVASPFLSSLPLEEHGLAWCWPEVDLVHPVEGRRAGVMVQSLEDTAIGLGVDGPAWRRAFAPLASGFGALAEDLMRRCHGTPCASCGSAWGPCNRRRCSLVVGRPTRHAPCSPASPPTPSSPCPAPRPPRSG